MKVKVPQNNAPTSAQATTAQVTTAQVDNCPWGKTALGQQLPQVTTAQVDNCPMGKTAPGRQLPRQDNCPSWEGETLFVWCTQARQKILGAKC